MTSEFRNGEALRERIADRYVIDETGWTVERVRRVADRLQTDVEPGERLEVLVVWLDSHNAFTAPGKYIYVSRRLLEQCRTDAMIAMVIAHEIAHHRLGHVHLRWPSAVTVSILFAYLKYRRCSKKHELDADAHAIELCIEAGYEANQCLELFDLLANIALDYGDIEGVFGDDRQKAAARSTHPAWKRRIRAAHSHARRCPKPATTQPSLYREAPIRSHCGHCPGDAAVDCASCERPLCRDHAHAGQQECLHCHASPTPLCKTCRKSDRCLACGDGFDCRHCRRRAIVGCTQCDWVFCERHRPTIEPRCLNCRIEAVHREDVRRSGWKTGLAVVALIVAMVVLVAFGMPVRV